jgi:lipopolysaccharide export system protein LptA
MTRTRAMLVGAVVAAAAIAAAPPAAAQTTQTNQPMESCQSTAQSSSVCQSPGNVEIKNSPPPVTFYPYGQPCPTCG